MLRPFWTFIIITYIVPACAGMSATIESQNHVVHRMHEVGAHLAFESHQGTVVVTEINMLGRPFENEYLAELGGTSLLRLDLSRCDIHDNDIQAIVGKCPNLRELNLSRTKITDASINLLRDITHLESVTFYVPKMNDESIQSLAKYQSLRSIWFGTERMDLALKALSVLPKLELLDLSEIKLSTQDLKILKDLPHLRTLLLTCNSKITDDHMRQIGELVELERLELFAPVSEHGLQQLSNLTRLRTLKIRVANKEIDGELLATTLSPIQTLTELSVVGFPFKKGSVSHLGRLSGLRALKPPSHLEDDDWVGLSRLIHLKKLDLSFTHTSDTSILHVVKLKSLEDLDLTQTHITDQALADLVVLEYLQRLAIGYTDVTKDGLASLRRMKHLHTLELSGRANDDVISEVAQLEGITELNLSGANVSDVGIKKLTQMKNLKRIDLSDTKITDVGIQELGNIKSLTEIRLDGVSISFAGIVELLGKLPDAKIYW